MNMTRRSFLTIGAATLAVPFTVSGADVKMAVSVAKKAADIEYAGADNFADYEAFFARQYRDNGHALVANVFHASWCAPCKVLFGQLHEFRQTPGIKFTTIGLDIDKYPNIMQALPLDKAYKNPPLMLIYRKGVLDPSYSMQGTLPVEKPSRMAVLENYWRQQTAVAYPAGAVTLPQAKP